MIRISCRARGWPRRWRWRSGPELADLVADTLTLKAKGGVNAHLKVPALVAGMVSGGLYR